MGMTALEGEAEHHAGKLCCNIVAGIQDACHDPDGILRDWVRYGAPIGITEPVIPGNLLPPFTSPAEVEQSDLMDAFWKKE